MSFSPYADVRKRTSWQGSLYHNIYIFSIVFSSLQYKSGAVSHSTYYITLPFYHTSSDARYSSTDRLIALELFVSAMNIGSTSGSNTQRYIQVNKLGKIYYNISLSSNEYVWNLHKYWDFQDLFLIRTPYSYIIIVKYLVSFLGFFYS